MSERAAAATDDGRVVRFVGLLLLQKEERRCDLVEVFLGQALQDVVLIKTELFELLKELFLLSLGHRQRIDFGWWLQRRQALSVGSCQYGEYDAGRRCWPYFVRPGMFTDLLDGDPLGRLKTEYTRDEILEL